MVVKAHLCARRLLAQLGARDPVHAAHLALLVGHGVLRLLLAQHAAAHLHDLARGVAAHLLAAHHIGVLQRDHLAGREAEELGLVRLLHVLAVHEQHLLVGQLALAARRILREQRRAQQREEVVGLVLQHQSHGPQHREGARGLGLETLAAEVFETRPVDGGECGAGDRDVLAETVDGLGGVAAATQALDGGHARVVPAAHDVVHHHVLQLALRHHRVGQVQTPELPHVRAPHVQLVHQPVVALAPHLELQRAERVVDVLQRVHQTVLEVVRGVDAPLVAHVRVRDVLDAVRHRVPHAWVRTVHVDLHAQRRLALPELPLPHVLEQTQILLHAPVAPWRLGVQI